MEEWRIVEKPETTCNRELTVVVSCCSRPPRLTARRKPGERGKPEGDGSSFGELYKQPVLKEGLCPKSNRRLS